MRRKNKIHAQNEQIIRKEREDMKKNKKKVLSFLLVLSMVLGLWTPAMVNAGHEVPVKVSSVEAENKSNLDELMHMNLTEEGTVDWLHLTSKEVHRKQTGGQVIQLKNLERFEGINYASDALKYKWSSCINGINRR